MLFSFVLSYPHLVWISLLDEHESIAGYVCGHRMYHRFRRCRALRSCRSGRPARDLPSSSPRVLELLCSATTSRELAVTILSIDGRALLHERAFPPCTYAIRSLYAAVNSQSLARRILGRSHAHGVDAIKQPSSALAMRGLCGCRPGSVEDNWTTDSARRSCVGVPRHASAGRCPSLLNPALICPNGSSHFSHRAPLPNVLEPLRRPSPRLTT